MEQRNDTYIYPALARRKLRYAKESGQPVYIFGMTGFGKTALVRHWLGRQKYLYIDAEHAVPEELDIPEEPAAAPQKRRTVVIDNLQFADRELLPGRLCGLLERRDLWLILVSRAMCPDYLMGYRLKGSGFVEITQDDLALSEQEVGEFLRRHGIELKQEDISEIRRESRGHGMALRISAGILSQESALRKGGPLYTPDVAHRCRLMLWDYLENQIYDHWEPYLAESICRLAIVDSFTKELAEAITGSAQIELLLKKCVDTGNFLTIRGGEYCLDDAVLQSMRRRQEKLYSKARRDELYAAAGSYYRRNGQIGKALELYTACGNHEQIADILAELSREYTGVSRLCDYRKYFLALEESDIAGSPALMRGMSMLCSLMLDIEKSEYWYEQLRQAAGAATGIRKRELRSCLAYLDLALPHRGTADAIRIITDIAALASGRQISLSEFSVTGNTMSNMNGGKDFCEWSRRDTELAKTIGGAVSLVLGRHGAGLVDLALAESYLEKGRDDYEVIRLASVGVMQAESGRVEERFVGEGIMARLHVRRGHIEDARGILLHFRETCEREGAEWLLPNLDASLCQLDLYQGNTRDYLDWMKHEAPPEGQDFIVTERCRYLVKIRIYLVQGRYQQAYSLLERMRYYARLYGRTYISMECTLLLAILQHRTGSGPWRDTLQEAYSQAEDYHFVRLLTREGGAALALFEEAGPGIEIRDTSFYEQTMEELRAMAKAYPAYLRENPAGEGFSENALRILRLQAAGVSNEKIAGQLGISVSTVKYHCRENYAKLGAKNRSAAVAEAQKRRLI